MTLKLPNKGKTIANFRSISYRTEKPKRKRRRRVPLKNYTWEIMARSLVKIWGKSQGTDIAIHPTENPTITPINSNKPSSDRAWKEPPPQQHNTTQHTRNTLFFQSYNYWRISNKQCSLHLFLCLWMYFSFFERIWKDWILFPNWVGSLGCLES